MGDNFFSSTQDVNYDDFVRAIFAGVSESEGALSEDKGENTIDGDYRAQFVASPLAKNNSQGDIYDFGSLRAAMFAYNSTGDITGMGNTSGRVKNNSTDETGTFYVKGPYWWAVRNITALPEGFDQLDALTLEYRDPTKEESKRLQLLDDDTAPVTLSSLIRMLTENTTTFGENAVELTEIFGEDGITRYKAVLEAMMDGNYSTQEIGEIDSLGSLGSMGTAPSIAAPTVGALGTIQVGSAQSGSLATPAAPTVAQPGTPPLVSYGQPEVNEGAEAVTYTAATYPAYVVKTEDLDEHLTSDTFDDLDTEFSGEQSIAAPTQQDMDAEIAAAVSAFTTEIGLRYTAQEAELRRSLSTSRRALSGYYDRAAAVLAAEKQAQINAFTQNLVAEQAKANLQAAVTHEQLLLQQKTRVAEIAREKAIFLTKMLFDYRTALQQAFLALTDLEVRTQIARSGDETQIKLAEGRDATQVNLANLEASVRTAVSGADNLTRASTTAADLTVRSNIAGAENITRASLAHAENLLRAATTLTEQITRVNLANADALTRANLAEQELRLRREITVAENTLKALLANQDVQSRFTLAEQDARLRLLLQQQDIEFRRRLANNQRILDEINMRANVARMINDVTLGWMAAKTSNAGALSNILTAAMSKHTQETVSGREFAMNAESQRWQAVMQRASLINGLADLKWRSQIQNLSVMQQTLASLGQATGTQSNPSPFQNWMTGISGVSNLISSVIGLGVALA